VAGRNSQQAGGALVLAALRRWVPGMDISKVFEANPLWMEHIFFDIAKSGVRSTSIVARTASIPKRCSEGLKLDLATSACSTNSIGHYGTKSEALPSLHTTLKPKFIILA
jgi:hypothetical protein